MGDSKLSGEMQIKIGSLITAITMIASLLVAETLFLKKFVNGPVTFPIPLVFHPSHKESYVGPHVLMHE